MSNSPDSTLEILIKLGLINENDARRAQTALNEIRQEVRDLQKEMATLNLAHQDAESAARKSAAAMGDTGSAILAMGLALDFLKRSYENVKSATNDPLHFEIPAVTPSPAPAAANARGKLAHADAGTEADQMAGRAFIDRGTEVTANRETDASSEKARVDRAKVAPQNAADASPKIPVENHPQRVPDDVGSATAAHIDLSSAHAALFADQRAVRELTAIVQQMAQLHREALPAFSAALASMLEVTRQESARVATLTQQVQNAATAGGMSQ
jgi:hypothetical protein